MSVLMRLELRQNLPRRKIVLGFWGDVICCLGKRRTLVGMLRAHIVSEVSDFLVGVEEGRNLLR